MELISREMPANYDLYDLSDLHLGSPNVNTKAIKKTFQKILKKENRFVIIKGDIIDCIPVTDRRFNVTSLEDRVVLTLQDQAEMALEYLEPIKDRLLTLHVGNHEHLVINQFDFVKYWCDALGVPWGGAISKFIHLKDGKPMWRGLFAHGNGSLNSVAKDAIQRKANMKAALKRKMEGLTSNVIVCSMGHTHKLLVCEPTYSDQVHVYDDGKTLKQTYRVHTDQSADIIDPEARWFVNTGSFLRTFSQPGKRQISYSEMAMYSPVELGYVVHKIRGHQFIKAKKVVV